MSESSSVSTSALHFLDFHDILRQDVGQERLPFNEGWRPSTTPTTLASLGAMIAEIQLASGETLPEGLVLGEAAYAAALAGLDPITGLLDSASHP